jgi:hypothetical protein
MAIGPRGAAAPWPPPGAPLSLVWGWSWLGSCPFMALRPLGRRGPGAHREYRIDGPPGREPTAAPAIPVPGDRAGRPRAARRLPCRGNQAHREPTDARHAAGSGMLPMLRPGTTYLSAAERARTDPASLPSPQRQNGSHPGSESTTTSRSSPRAARDGSAGPGTAPPASTRAGPRLAPGHGSRSCPPDVQARSQLTWAC